ncbi:GntP family permease [Neolewinella aurantiaca]|uniref:GntP family permease n=1 Tax=Neolewinella aurantiaca TaxID=2602767 RepID=A0A5C7FT82_9BACT|nr:GntP family permease [Neolewinella aurantiaca]TXF87968.1 GntP family permease [Neolewinella aurantiaca]
MLQLIVLLVVLLLLVLAVSRWRWHPFIALLLAALALGLCSGQGGEETVRLLGEGFGNTLKWIAIVVILGAFIGEVLRETGGALRIANTVVKRFGEQRLTWAMGFTGYLVSIPVFVDVAYIVLQPVTEAIAVRARKPVLVIGLALTAGLTVSHTLLPPTPGPLAVASLLGADIGRLLVINAFVGLFALAGGVLWARYFCKDSWIDYDQKLAGKFRSTPAPAGEDFTIPESPLLDLLPILIPILLMGAGAFLQTEEASLFQEIIGFFSTPMVAVMVGAGVAALQYRRKTAGGTLGKLVEQAITKSALVIMITGAGGAFGFLIKESGVQSLLTAFFAELPFLGFFLPFLLAAVLTTATGSITVSLIGAASMVGPLVEQLPYSPELLAAITGCGAFCVFHANSSFFWLLNRLHRVPVPVLYRTYTLQSLVMGLSGLAGVGLLYLLGVG